MNYRIEVPLRIRSEANLADHWAVKKKRKDFQKLIVRAAWNKEINCKIQLPVKVTLTRFAKQFMDSDNLLTGFKYVRDQIADLLKPGLAPGRADGEGDITFEYKQEKSKEYWVVIEVEEL